MKGYPLRIKIAFWLAMLLFIIMILTQCSHATEYLYEKGVNYSNISKFVKEIPVTEFNGLNQIRFTNELNYENDGYFYFLYKWTNKEKHTYRITKSTITVYNINTMDENRLRYVLWHELGHFKELKSKRPLNLSEEYAHNYATAHI